MSKTQSKTKIVAANSGRFAISSSSSSTSSMYYDKLYTPTDHLAKSDTIKNVEDAVLLYIKARRRLGHTTVNTAEIARVLKLSRKTVEMAAANLRSVGVKKKK